MLNLITEIIISYGYSLTLIIKNIIKVRTRYIEMCKI